MSAKENLSAVYRKFDSKLGGNLSRIGLVAAVAASTGGVGCGTTTPSSNPEATPTTKAEQLVATQTSTTLIVKPTETPVPPTATTEPEKTPTNIPVPSPTEKPKTPEALKIHGVYTGDLVPVDGSNSHGKITLYPITSFFVITLFINNDGTKTSFAVYRAPKMKVGWAAGDPFTNITIIPENGEINGEYKTKESYSGTQYTTVGKYSASYVGEGSQVLGEEWLKDNKETHGRRYESPTDALNDIKQLLDQRAVSEKTQTPWEIPWD